MNELLKHNHEVINDAWQFLKRYACDQDPDWQESMDEDFFELYRRHNGPESDFAHRILDAVLGEVLKHHETGGET